MRRTSHEREAVKPGRYESHTQSIAGIDRESLEGVMREDVFLAVDGKALALDSIDLWTQPRRDGRRS
jgi:hypothetical protein